MKKTCSYFYKNFNKCNNICIADSDYCHIKSHHDSDERYLKHLNTLLSSFYEISQSLDSFKIMDVPKDGACAYRAMAIALVDNIKNDKLTKPTVTEITKIAKLLQQIIRKWIVKNKDQIVEEIDGLTLEEFVLFTHNLSNLEKYNELYKIFAGKFDYITINTRKAGKVKKVKIDDRWGGGPEFYAFSKIFDINCEIYLPRKLDTKKCKINKSAIKNKNTRIILYQSFNKNMENNRIKFLLNDSGSPHYQYLVDIYE